MAELRARAEAATADELEQWIRDVRPAVRKAGREELETRGLRPTPDTMSV